MATNKLVYLGQTKERQKLAKDSKNTELGGIPT
jgi:hypothetical protein